MVKIVSNKMQIERLVQLMLENENIAKGVCPKTMLQKKWECFSLELNSLGPPQREWQKWLRVWTDLKCKTKKKLKNKTEINATGGGPNRLHNFTDTEEAVIRLMEIDALINPPGKEFGCDDSNYTIKSMDSTTKPPDPKQFPQQPKPRNLVEHQTTSQDKFHKDMTGLMTDVKKTMRNIEHYMKKSVQQREDIIKLKIEKLNAYKENNESKRLDRKAKLELRTQLRELKKQTK